LLKALKKGKDLEGKKHFVGGKKVSQAAREGDINKKKGGVKLKGGHS